MQFDASQDANAAQPRRGKARADEPGMAAAIVCVSQVLQ